MGKARQFRWESCGVREPDRNDAVFSRREIREYAGWSNSRVHRYLQELVDLEYVLVAGGRNGATYRYRLAYDGEGKDGARFMLGLKAVEDLWSRGLSASAGAPMNKLRSSSTVFRAFHTLFSPGVRARLEGKR